MAPKVDVLSGWLGRILDDVFRPDLGLRGERAAARELKRRGYRILDRRWRCRLGEIDLVARDGETLVIVEVKARSRTDYGAPVNAIDGPKRRRLERLARAYLKARRLGEVSVRFDAVGVTFLAGERPRIEVYRNVSSSGSFRPF